MRPVYHRMRLLVSCLLVLTITARGMAQRDMKTDDEQPQRVKLVRGKTLDEWIVQAKTGPTLEDRHHALQVLRNDGLKHDRDRTLRAFSDALSDKVQTVQSLAAAGLRKAGKPTDPKAPKKLVEIISKDLSAAKPPQLQRRKESEVGSGDFGLAMRVLSALEEIGEEDHISALRRITENKRVHPLLRQSAEKAIRQIEKRTNEIRSDCCIELPGLRSVAQAHAVV